MKKNQHPDSRNKILIFCCSCGILCVLVLLVSLIIHGKEVRPSNIRGLLLGIQGLGIMLLGDLPDTLNTWYNEFFLAPMLVKLLCALPFVGLIGGCILYFDLLPELPKIKIPQKKPVQVPPQASAEQETRPNTDNKPEIDLSSILVEQHRLAVQRHAALQSSCKGLDPFRSGMPVVRVQGTSPDPSRNKDELLEWSGIAAVIPLSGTHEIMLELNAEKVPCIVCLSSDDAGEPSEELYPLEYGVPLRIMRQDDSAPVPHYTITWIGG